MNNLDESQNNFKYHSAEYQGNHLVVTSSNHRNNQCRISKLDKDHYVNKTTGRICKFQHHKNRVGNIESLKKSFNHLRALINTNATQPWKLRFTTLTYRENMTDHNRLYNDFNKFWKRFCYWHKKENLPKPEFISIKEPQKRGAWHLHVLLIYPSKAPYIENDKLSEIWGLGFTYIESVRNDVENLGLYLTNPIFNLEADDDEDDEDDDQILNEKSVIKGGRLELYPVGVKLYSTSRGIKRPEKREISEEELELIRAISDKTYEKIYDGIDARTGFNYVYMREWFNKKDHLNRSA